MPLLSPWNFPDIRLFASRISTGDKSGGSEGDRIAEQARAVFARRYNVAQAPEEELVRRACLQSCKEDIFVAEMPCLCNIIPKAMLN